MWNQHKILLSTKSFQGQVPSNEKLISFFLEYWESLFIVFGLSRIFYEECQRKPNEDFLHRPYFYEVCLPKVILSMNPVNLEKDNMINHTWKKLDSVIVLFAVIFAIGIFVPCIIALNNGHVSPYVPYISEGGGAYPEAGIFSICISLSSFLWQWIITLRYFVVEELNSTTGNEMNQFLNKISLVLGSLSSIALVVVASYPASTINQAHNSAAGVASVCYVIYLFCQTLISFRILGRTGISICRLVITVCSTLALIFITTFGLIGSSQWTAEYWAGKKTPQDKGFEFYVVSAASEWILAALVVLFFSTYLAEFKKSTLHFQIEIAGRVEIKPRLTNLDIRHR